MSTHSKINLDRLDELDASLYLMLVNQPNTYVDSFVEYLARGDEKGVRCGKGFMSPGEVCRVGAAKVKQAVQKGNEREKKLREKIKDKYGVEVPSRAALAKEAAVAAAGAAGGFVGHEVAVIAPTVTRAIVETGHRIYDAKTAKLRLDLIEEIERETAKELAGGVVGETAGTIAGETAKVVARQVAGGALGPPGEAAIGIAAGLPAGMTAAMKTQEPLAKAALRMKRRRKNKEGGDA